MGVGQAAFEFTGATAEEVIERDHAVREFSGRDAEEAAGHAGAESDAAE